MHQPGPAGPVRGLSAAVGHAALSAPVAGLRPGGRCDERHRSKHRRPRPHATFERRTPPQAPGRAGEAALRTGLGIAHRHRAAAGRRRAGRALRAGDYAPAVSFRRRYSGAAVPAAALRPWCPGLGALARGALAAVLRPWCPRRGAAAGCAMIGPPPPLLRSPPPPLLRRPPPPLLRRPPPNLRLRRRAPAVRRRPWPPRSASARWDRRGWRRGGAPWPAAATPP